MESILFIDFYRNETWNRYCFSRVLWKWNIESLVIDLVPFNISVCYHKNIVTSIFFCLQKFTLGTSYQTVFTAAFWIHPILFYI